MYDSEDVSVLFVFSLALAQHRKNTFIQNHFLFMLFSNLRVKSSNTKIIKNNIFEGLIHQFV